MPEYLAPGVYVEETSFRAKSIEGVGTSTTAFVGPTRKGPFRLDLDDLSTPELLTSYGDFERIYGSFADLDFGAGVAATNFVAHAARAFFNEGGGRLYVARVFAGDRAAGPHRSQSGGGRRQPSRIRRALSRRGRQRPHHRTRSRDTRLGHRDDQRAGRKPAAHRTG